MHAAMQAAGSSHSAQQDMFPSQFSWPVRLQYNEGALMYMWERKF